MAEIVIRRPQGWCAGRVPPLANITVNGVLLPLGDAIYHDQRGCRIEHADGSSTHLGKSTITYVSEY